MSLKGRFQQLLDRALALSQKQAVVIACVALTGSVALGGLSVYPGSNSSTPEDFYNSMQRSLPWNDETSEENNNDDASDASSEEEQDTPLPDTGEAVSPQSTPSSGSANVNSSSNSGAAADRASDTTLSGSDNKPSSTNNKQDSDTSSDSNLNSDINKDQPDDNDKPNVDPVDPNDPDPAGSDLPQGSFDGLDPQLASAVSYPSDGIAHYKDGDGISIRFMSETDTKKLGVSAEEVGLEPLYQGMHLNDSKLMRAGYYFVSYRSSESDSRTTYRIESSGENFVIGDYPKTISEGTKSLSVDFKFRPNAKSEWKKFSLKYPVHLAKVRVNGWESGSYLRSVCVDKGELLDLSDYYGQMLSEDIQSSADSSDTPVVLDQLFTGWSDDTSSAPVASRYEASRSGLIDLVPLELEEVPVGMSVGYDPNGLGQVLLSYEGDEGVCDIPEGVHAIASNAPADDDSSAADSVVAEADTVSIPTSLEVIPRASLRAHDTFEVAKGNVCYRADKGALVDVGYGNGYSSDASIVSIPSTLKTLTVESDISSILVDGELSIEAYQMKGAPFALEDSGLDKLKGVTVRVPVLLYLTYYDAWGLHPGDPSNRLTYDVMVRQTSRFSS